MRTVCNINHKWAFRKGAPLPETFPADWDLVNLPHSWNNIDGQDGGNDYWRGTAVYVRALERADLPEAEAYFLEVNGANSSADAYLNGEKLAHHDGGYSTWRVELTGRLQEENLLVITVDNAPNDRVYPQSADFTFYGVSRHQDGWQKGNAITREDHIRDMDLICEVGANTIRLAHYQHDQFFYDLCDERGMVVWAEIPYISQHMPGGRANTLSQMRELIVQNHHHASIVVWGLSNEITMKGDKDPGLLDNHHELNDLCHTMDPTRPTVMAVVSMCPTDSPYLEIPDAISYNHYFGWYGGDTAMNGPWFDKFHAEHPTLPIGCSEYGCEALNWHSDTPQQGDYTEEYQAYYHEELIKQLFSRPYIWATHVWNMFDFGADARNEGGENGQNHKGLVTIDRQYKKDAFYAYKAWLSDEPFVHLCGKRFVNHTGDTVRITVYSNQPQVELFANGVSLGAQQAEDHFFRFTVPNRGVTRLEAVAGACRDSGTICHVDTPDERYRLRERGAILNWFDVTENEGFYSLNDRISDIMKAPEGKQVILDLLAMVGMGGKGEPDENFARMIGGFTVLRLSGLVGTLGENKLTKETLLSLNARLNTVARV